MTTNPAGLTPIEIVVSAQFSKKDITTEVQEYYASMPKVYPDFNGGWQPHIVFVGEIIEVRDER